MPASTRRRRAQLPLSTGFRRSPHVVSFWQQGRLIIFNYATGVSVPGTPLVVELLDDLTEWRTWTDLSAGRSLEEQKLLRRLVGLMVKRTFLTRSTDKPQTIDGALSRWGTWNPAAGFFHRSTRDLDFTSTPEDQVAASCAKAQVDPLPASLKPERPGAVQLPPAKFAGDLASALLTRRTWRCFGRGPIEFDRLVTLLQLTWGVHGWIQVPGVGRFALKTSPSGGARHSIEVYVLARKVDGLRRGLYHYHPDTHRLGLVRRGGPRHVSDYLPGQPWYDDACAVMLMTAVFERVQWRYPYARAYRAVLAESGHLCQTFCLLATSLGLAPFCTMALADSRIERDLKIDGVSEAVIYAAGVGIRPTGIEWAPWPGTSEVPQLTPPAHAVRNRRGRSRLRSA
jgi:SagB-type dehydrogenase family enzyme